MPGCDDRRRGVIFYHAWQAETSRETTHLRYVCVCVTDTKQMCPYTTIHIIIFWLRDLI